jgi:hypothetical protein
MSALLHRFGTSEMRVFPLSMPSLIGSMTTQGASCISEVCLSRLSLARRTAPSIVLLPRIELLWEASPRVLQIAIRQWFEELPRSCPVLVLASSALKKRDLPSDIQSFFQNVHEMSLPNRDQRKAFFEEIVRDIDCVKIVDDSVSEETTTTTTRKLKKRRRKKLERAQVPDESKTSESSLENKTKVRGVRATINTRINARTRQKLNSHSNTGTTRRVR